MKRGVSKYNEAVENKVKKYFRRYLSNLWLLISGKINLQANCLSWYQTVQLRSLSPIL